MSIVLSPIWESAIRNMKKEGKGIENILHNIGQDRYFAVDNGLDYNSLPFDELARYIKNLKVKA